VLQGKTLPSVIHTYQIAGSAINRKTQTSNLQQKVAEARETALRLEADLVLRAPEEEEPEDNEKEIYRYFKGNVRCFRCKKVGHHNYACLNQLCCQLCLSPAHHTEKCPQKIVCYRCYQYGHIIDECPSPVCPFCQNCKRKHPKRCSFLTRGIDPIKQMFNTDYLYNDPAIRCMKCMQYGHLICAGSARLSESQDAN
jgi:hypothetical protein